MVSKKNPLAFGDMRATQVHTISPSYNSKVSYSLWHYGTNILTVMQPVLPGIDHIKAVYNYNQYHIINFISLSPRSKSNQFNPYWHNFDHISSKCLESATILDKVDMTLALIAEAQFSHLCLLNSARHFSIKSEVLVYYGERELYDGNTMILKYNFLCLFFSVSSVCCWKFCSFQTSKAENLAACSSVRLCLGEAGLLAKHQNANMLTIATANADV